MNDAVIMCPLYAFLVCTLIIGLASVDINCLIYSDMLEDSARKTGPPSRRPTWA